MIAPYIPTRDADLDNWSANFSTLITATPTAYGLVSGDATAIAAVVDDFHDAFLLAVNPATRTSPNIAAKDTAKAVMLATVRPYAQQVRDDASVSDSLKVGLGLNLQNNTRPRIPAPTTQPDLKLVAINPGVATIQYSDVTTPLSKAKPAGVIGLELWQTIGTAPATTPEDAAYVQTISKSPNTVAFSNDDKGKTATLFGRWITKSGPAGVAQVGPWSTALAFVIA